MNSDFLSHWCLQDTFVGGGGLFCFVLGLKNKHSFPKDLEAGKLKVKMPAEEVSGENPLPES